MQNIDTFIARKKGKEAIRYPDDSLIPILKNTYGVIVYQEQIMQIASTMAGFTLGQSDILRRAVSKKKKDVLLYMNILKNLQTMDSIGRMHLLIPSWDSKWHI